MNEVKELSLINDELMNLMTELKGLREMVNTVAISVNYYSVIESAEEKLNRLAAPYPAIVSALDNVITKLNVYTNDLDYLDTHLNYADGDEE